MSAAVATCLRRLRPVPSRLLHHTGYRLRCFSSLTQIKQSEQAFTAKYPQFARSIQSVFPGSMMINEYFLHVNAMTTSLGFMRENTMAMMALCRDEIVQPAADEVLKYWQQAFNCHSLAGSITFGTTGLGAALGHCPIDDKDGKRRFVFVAMPHIAISANGNIGGCQRRGIAAESSACGALNAIVGQLKSGEQLDVLLNLSDLEQSVLRLRVAQQLNDGDKPSLDELTKIVCGMVTNDVKKLLTDNVDHDIFEYAVVTGVQIHGPDGVDWVCPSASWHGSNMYESKQRQLTLPK